MYVYLGEFVYSKVNHLLDKDFRKRIQLECCKCCNN